MNLEVSTYTATWSAGFVLAAGICAVWFLYMVIRRMQKGALMYSLAYEATQDFYNLAGEVIEDPATPDELEDTLIFMAELITDDQKGKKFYEFFKRSDIPDEQKSPLSDAIQSLAKHRIDLYEKANDAFSSWIFAISATHGHSDASVSITMARNADRGFLLSMAERIKALFDQNGNDGIDGGKMIPVKSSC